MDQPTVAPATPPPAPSAPEVSEVDERRITPGRIVTTILVFAMVALWVYAFSGLARKDPPDLLDDPAFAAAAERICAPAVDDIAELPAAQDSTGPEDRAVTVVAANEILAEMVADLRAIAPDGESRDADITGRWLDDWETVVSDRAAYADALADGSEDPPEFTARGSRSITATVDNFAEVNDMESCATSLDL